MQGKAQQVINVNVPDTSEGLAEKVLIGVVVSLVVAAVTYIIKYGKRLRTKSQ